MSGETLALILFTLVAVILQQQKIIRNSALSTNVSGSILMASASTEANKPSAKKKKAIVSLTTLPYEKGFYFYTGLGKYTGITATSLYEFAGKLQTIPVESISFHFQRDDFQKWLRNTIGEDELATRIDQLKKWPSWSSDENLRKELVKTVQKRLSELKQLP